MANGTRFGTDLIPPSCWQSYLHSMLLNVNIGPDREDIRESGHKCLS